MEKAEDRTKQLTTIGRQLRVGTSYHMTFAIIYLLDTSDRYSLARKKGPG